MKQIFYILSLMAVLLLASCKESELPQPSPGGGDVALVFNSNAGDRNTRAAGGELLHDLGYQTFGVWTWRTMNNTTWLSVMDHYHVSYDAKYAGEGREESGWGYDKETAYTSQVLKYWSLGSKQYEFKGYAPWVGKARSVGDTDPYVDMDGTARKLSYHNVGGHFPAQELETAYPASTDPEYATKKNRVDWLYTDCGRQLDPVPISPALLDHDNTLASSHASYYIGNNDYTLTKTVPLRFHHLLPKVIFRLHIYNPDDLNEVINENIAISVMSHDKFPIQAGEVSYTPSPYSSSMTAHAPAEFVETGGTAAQQWTTEQAREFSKSSGTDYQDISPVAVGGSQQGWLELPQQAPVFDVRLRFRGLDYVRQMDYSLDTNLPSVWEPDHIYVYVINFNVKTLAMDVTSYMEEWTSSDDDFQITDW